MFSHKTYTQMSFCFRIPKLRVPKFSILGLLRFWRAITSCANLWLKWSLKKNFSPHRELSNNMLHPTYMQVNKGDSWLLVVRSQINNLIIDPSFGHNLYFKYPNGSCEPILDIFLPITFKWYNENFNRLSFDPCNRSLKIWKSIGTLIPKVGAHLGVWGFIPSHSHVLLGPWNVIPMLHSWPAPL
jgi:hypothetical protein